MLQFAVEDPVILHELIAAKNCIYLPPLDVNKTGSKLPKFTSYLLFDIQILFLHDRLRFETDLHDLITYFIQLGTGLQGADMELSPPYYSTTVVRGWQLHVRTL